MSVERDGLQIRLTESETRRADLDLAVQNLSAERNALQVNLEGVSRASELQMVDCRKIFDRLEGEKLVLNQRIREITNTRLWRAAVWAYPKYYKLTMFFPAIFRSAVRRAVGWLGTPRSVENQSAESEDQNRMSK